ncbi:uncharacterized protein LOC121395471 [Xenopus laevis]|uniref:Uncharacterized protein LOC121395471 n=1 Tax=Xenopus laevis TaxID=8355 RepID=A0A8J1L614_XENLA|nr:uncharacterized protein LOC121395471 [Xenopus laevis]
MDATKYRLEVHRQLEVPGHYSPIEQDPTTQLKKVIDLMIMEAFDMGVIDKSTKEFLTTDFPRIPTLYVLPKIHKTLENPPGRPIVSGIGSLLEPLSKFIDHHLQELVRNLPTCLKDTNDLLIKLEGVPKLSPGVLLCSIDIQSLFTAIPQDEGIKCIEEALLETNMSNAKLYFILDCLEVVLKKNYFKFEDFFYWQRQGTSMGSAVAPSLANLFVFDLEKKLFLKEPYLQYIVHYYRYVDDILIIWDGPRETFMDMVEQANTAHKTVKFTMEVSDTAINFLDVQIKLENNSLSTNLYRKEMDRNNLLHRKSFHNPQTLNAIPKGQYMRAKKIASSNTGYKMACKELTERFVQRGYPKGQLRAVENEVQKIERGDLLKPRKREVDSERITFVSKYDKRSKMVEKIVKQYWPILQTDTISGLAFKKPPRFAYKKGKSISDTLCSIEKMDSKYNPMVSKKVGTFPCLGCNCCSSIIKGPNIHHPISGQEIKLNTFATCKTAYVIYVLKCPCGLVYVGKTIRPVHMRIKEHKGNIRNFKAGTYSDTPVSRHFFEHKHNACQLKWKVLEVVPNPVRGGDHNNLLLQREARWISRLECISPKGLNEQYNLICFL